MEPLCKGRFLPTLIVCIAMTVPLVASEPVGADDCKGVQNILVLFDASGYMKEKNFYDQLLQQMSYFVDAMPVTADGFFNVGLRHYGLKVGLGCNNTESILPIEPWDPERFSNSFPKSVSYGVSSLCTGLREAADEAAAASGKTVILLIGGGVESCKADPINVADRIGINNPDLEIHTFQVGNLQEGQFVLEGIAAKCRGTYHNAAAMTSSADWHLWMRRYLVVPCGQGAGAPGAIPPKRLGPVTFDYKSISVRSRDAAVDAANMANLDAVGRHLQANPAARVVLHGFTDGKGSQDYNLRLSRQRAEAVAKYLQSTYGIPSARVGIVAHGIAQEAPGPPGQPQVGGRRSVEFELLD